MKRRKLIAALPVGVLSGCAAPLAAISGLPIVRDGDVVSNDQSVMLTKVQVSGLPARADTTGMNLTVYREDGFFRTGTVPIKDGEATYAFALTPGNYRWAHLICWNLSANFGVSLPFSVSAKTATYVGSIRIHLDFPNRQYRLAVLDESGVARKRFEEEFPNLSKSHSFTTRITRDERS